MSNTKKENTVVWILAAICLLTLGWFARQLTLKLPDMGKQAAAVPLVSAKTVEEGLVNPPKRYVGHVQAVQDVEIKARVSGYLAQVNFKEGGVVKEGDLLFKIDEEDYKAKVGLCKAQVAKAEASLDRYAKILHRLESADARSVSLMDLDNTRADVATSKAALTEAQANLTLAEIDLKHTSIYSPVNGQIGQKLVSKGDFVSAANGVLAKIVQRDPIRVVFSVTDRDFLDYKARAVGGDILNNSAAIVLPDGSDYKVRGQWEFIGNEMSLGTASLPIWINVANPDGLLIPNTYVTVKVDGSATAKTPIVDIASVTRSVQGAYVYTLTPSNTVEMCRIELGASEEAVFAVTKGLSAGARVITEGIQLVRPGMAVELKK